MATHKIEKLRTKVARLETEIAHDMYVELAVLPKQFGFSSVAEFLRSVAEAARGGPRKGSARPRRRKRAKITDAIRAEVRKLVKAGKTGAQIAKAVGISLPSVQNVKKAIGLIGKARKSAPKKRKKRPPQKKPAALEGTPVHQLPIETFIPPG
jgi:hypothetical protein